MKKIALLLAVLMLCGTLFACGDNTPADTDKSTSTSKATEKTPEETEKTPESSEQVPESSEQVPESSEQAPESSEQAPESSEQAPESSSEKEEIPVNPAPFLGFETSYTTEFDLTANGTKYWEFYGELDGTTETEQHKANATDIINTTFNHVQSHWDNKAPVIWSDGENIPSCTTLHGRNSYNDITVTINTAGCAEAKFLVGAWKSTNQLTIMDANGSTLETQDVVVADENASMTLISINLTKYTGGEQITVMFSAVNKVDNGNVSLTAVTVR